MIQLTVEQRRKTAQVMVALSAIGAICSAYLFHAAYVLLRREPFAWIDAGVFALGALFIALIVLLGWFGAYCLLYRYASSVTRLAGELEITTDAEKFGVKDESVRVVWTTGKTFVAGVKGGVRFVFILFGRRLFVCAKENAQGIA